MYKYIKIIGSKISSFFQYIFRKCTGKHSHHKKNDDNCDDENDSEDDIIWYDNIYYDDKSKRLIHSALLDD